MFKLRTYAKPNWLKKNCFDIETVRKLNWIVWNGTVLDAKLSYLK